MIKSHLKNLIKDGLFEPSNFLRLLGVATNRAFTGPLKVTIDITNRCDMGCIMCWYHSPQGGKYAANYTPQDLPLPLLQSTFKELKSIHTRTVLLCGEGEPLLHPEIKEIIAGAAKAGLKVEIMTNAFYLDKKKADFILQKKVSKVIVSLHSASQNSFLKIRPQRQAEDFNVIIGNLRYLSRRRGSSLRLYISNVISSLNAEEIPAIAKLTEELKAEKLLFKPLLLPPPLPQDIQPQKAAVRKYLRQIMREHATVPHNAGNYLRNTAPPAPFKGRFKKGGEKRSRCLIPWIHSVISLSGEVFGCTYALRKPLGNIYKNGFGAIWKSYLYREFRTGKYCPQKCLGKAVYPLSF